MDELQLNNIQYTSIVLQLEDISISKSDGILKYVLVSLGSWKYLVDFMILTPIKNLGGNELRLGMAWLATNDALIW